MHPSGCGATDPMVRVASGAAPVLHSLRSAVQTWAHALRAPTLRTSTVVTHARTRTQEPTCARIIVLGSMLPVAPGDAALARAAVFARHPAAAAWPADHGFAL
jgi:hypothetical protein